MQLGNLQVDVIYVAYKDLKTNQDTHIKEKRYKIVVVLQEG